MDAGLTGRPTHDAGRLRSRLLGTWRLLDWEATGADGVGWRPFGDLPLGYVVYTHDGRMITTISRAHRAAVGGDLLSAPDAGRAAAFASFLAYSGTFSLEGADVLHHVEVSLYPDWVGTTQRRHVDLSADDSTLTLSTAPTGDPPARHRLRWRRVTAEGRW